MVKENPISEAQRQFEVMSREGQKTFLEGMIGKGADWTKLVATYGPQASAYLPAKLPPAIGIVGESSELPGEEPSGSSGAWEQFNAMSELDKKSFLRTGLQIEVSLDELKQKYGPQVAIDFPVMEEDTYYFLDPFQDSYPGENKTQKQRVSKYLVACCRQALERKKSYVSVLFQNGMCLFRIETKAAPKVAGGQRIVPVPMFTQKST